MKPPKAGVNINPEVGTDRSKTGPIVVRFPWGRLFRGAAVKGKVWALYCTSSDGGRGTHDTNMCIVCLSTFLAF